MPYTNYLSLTDVDGTPVALPVDFNGQTVENVALENLPAVPDNTDTALSYEGRIITADRVGPSAADFPVAGRMRINGDWTDIVDTEQWLGLIGSMYGLVFNGGGHYGTNRNWTNGQTLATLAEANQLVYDGSMSPLGLPASFRHEGSYLPVVSEFEIPIDPSVMYEVSCYARQEDDGYTGTFYAGFIAYDIDGLAVRPRTVAWEPGTRTTLGAAINPGDTTVTLDPADTAAISAWQAASATLAATFNGVAVEGYTDSRGGTYDVYTQNLATGGATISGNVVTLSSAYTGQAQPAGTRVRLAVESAHFQYTAAANQAAPTDAWQRYAGTIGGIDLSGSLANAASGSFFRDGTVSVRYLILPNFNIPVGNVGHRQWFAGMRVAEVGSVMVSNNADGTVLVEQGAAFQVLEDAGQSVGAAPSFTGTASGTGTTTGFTFVHSLNTSTPTVSAVIVDGHVISDGWSAEIVDANTVTLNFELAPPTGASNITIKVAS